MKNKFKEFGYGLISVWLFQIVLAIVSIKTSVNFIQLKNYTNTESLSYSQFIIEIILNLLLITSIILMLFRKKLSIILYIISVISSLILTLFFGTLELSSVIFSLILPSLTILLVYIKRKLFT